MHPQPKLERWEKHTEWPLAAIAAAFLVSYSIDVLVRPHGFSAKAVSAVTTVAYIVFVIDYIARLSLASDRRRWFFRHLFDLAIVTLPLLRPLRLLRLVLLIAALQKAVGSAIHGRIIAYAISGAVLLIYVASLAELEAERANPNASIKTFGQAVWWSITTITTVGYGDLIPVTTTGRVIAVLLMIGGISLVGSITATLASWIVQRVAAEDTTSQAATAAQIDELRAEVRHLAEQLRLNGQRTASELTPAKGSQHEGP